MSNLQRVSYSYRVLSISCDNFCLGRATSHSYMSLLSIQIVVLNRLFSSIVRFAKHRRRLVLGCCVCRIHGIWIIFRITGLLIYFLNLIHNWECANICSVHIDDFRTKWQVLSYCFLKAFWTVFIKKSFIWRLRHNYVRFVNHIFSFK